MSDNYVHFSKSEFTPQEHLSDCSRPPSEGGYGLAGGGMGAYEVCPECFAILSKVLDDDE